MVFQQILHRKQDGWDQLRRVNAGRQRVSSSMVSPFVFAVRLFQGGHEGGTAMEILGIFCTQKKQREVALGSKREDPRR